MFRTVRLSTSSAYAFFKQYVSSFSCRHLTTLFPPQNVSSVEWNGEVTFNEQQVMMWKKTVLNRFKCNYKPEICLIKIEVYLLTWNFGKNTE